MIINSDDALTYPTDPHGLHQVYNALDCCVPIEIVERLLPRLEDDEDAARVYAFERAMQGPAMTMAVRGMCVDEEACAPVVAKLHEAEARCCELLNRLAGAWGVEAVNPLSPKQVAGLLYGACGERPYKNREGGVTTGDDALEDIEIRSPVVGTLAALIRRARELRKAVGFVEAKRSPDGRLRCSFNVGATSTGRWSSSKDVFGEGLNFFNLPKPARAIIIPSSPSRVLVNVDLKQAESCIVAHISGDAGYIRAHEGDVHTAVARDVLGVPPELARAPDGSGRIPRQIAKSLQHGTNYGLGERHAARMAKMRVGEMREKRRAYFTKYRGVRRRIDEMGARLRQNPRFLSVMGRPHTHMGLAWQPETQRKALADEPQGVVADILNIALYRLWSKYDGTRLWLLNQNYDSILFEAEQEGLDETLALVRAEMAVEVEINGITVVLGCDVGVGRNWKEASA